MLKKQVPPKIVAIVFAVIVVCFAIAVYVSAWTEPTAIPPGTNVPAPLNVSNTGQTKIGGLALNTGPDGLISADGAAMGLLIYEGNVGIGTTSPDHRLQIQGGVDIFESSIAGGDIAFIDFETAGTGMRDYRIGVTGGSPPSGYPTSAFFIADVSGDPTESNAPLYTYGVPFVIKNGNVGIGTTAPDATLQVNGTVKIIGNRVIRQAWSDFNKTYQATTDGFVTAYVREDDNDEHGILLSGLVGNSDPPNITVARCSARREYDVDYAFISFPVRKGEFWSVRWDHSPEEGAGYVRLIWTPLGN